MAAFKICDKIDNLDQKFCLMIFSERKNQNFQSKGKINIIAYFSVQPFLPYQFYVLKSDALTWKHIQIRVTREEMNDFYLAKLTPSFINFKYSQVLQFSNTWG